MSVRVWKAASKERPQESKRHSSPRVGSQRLASDLRRSQS
jgi:hypothetical protein